MRGVPRGGAQDPPRWFLFTSRCSRRYIGGPGEQVGAQVSPGGAQVN